MLISSVISATLSGLRSHTSLCWPPIRPIVRTTRRYPLPLEVADALDVAVMDAVALALAVDVAVAEPPSPPPPVPPSDDDVITGVSEAVDAPPPIDEEVNDMEADADALPDDVTDALLLEVTLAEDDGE